MLTLNKQPILKNANFPQRQKSYKTATLCSEDFKKKIDERRAIFEKTRKTDLKKLHNQLVIISKEEMKFTKEVFNEIVPPDGIDKLRNLFVPKEKNTDITIIDDEDYFNEAV